MHRLQVHDHQDQHVSPLMALRGPADAQDVLAELARPGSCIRESWFRGTTPLGSDRLPQHVACLIGPGAPGAPGTQVASSIQQEPAASAAAADHPARLAHGHDAEGPA
mgnify:CR=1 FL=1